MSESDQSFKIGSDKIKELVSNTADISLLLNRSGVIKRVFINREFKISSNTETWLNKNIKDFLTLESIEKITTFLSKAWSKENYTHQPIELNHVDEKNWEFPVEYSYTIINESSVLISGRDLKNIAEMQQQLINAQLSLEKEYEKYRGYDTRFRFILETSNENIVILDAQTGKITDANASAVRLLGSDLMPLTDTEFHKIFKNQEKEPLLAELKNNNGQKIIDSNKYILKKGNVEILIFPTLLRANNDILIVCKLESATSKSNNSQDFVSALQTLYDKSPDGMIFTDRNGSINYSNESFLSICDIADIGDIHSKSLGDFLVRGSIDLRVLIENTKAKGKMQFYSSKIKTNFGRQTIVEISATSLGEQNNPAFAFVIKDASRIDTDRNDSDAVSEKALQNVMKLVGSAPLKELVADTSDVVERLCIETAIELTGNNRVAAADMLGVSRQSLYVKLRKYDLMSKEATTY
tara:strand:- start:1485 stop:2885 length:1401 start_codon:yes stop_codon:yes gene_type:complete